jgi:tetratricopeptide (TPR) repeat protein
VTTRPDDFETAPGDPLEDLLVERLLRDGRVDPQRIAHAQALAARERISFELALLRSGAASGDDLRETLGEALAAPASGQDSWELGAVPDEDPGRQGLSPDQDWVWLNERLQLQTRRELGRGGMGTVHLVQDPRLGREAALKVLSRRGGRAEQRFQREATVTAQLDHPGIPPVYAAGRTERGDAYLLIRYLPGRSLADHIQEAHRAAPPPLEELRPLLRHLVRVCEAVAYAHSRGILHRDLKPENVILGGFGEVCVADWGLARDLRLGAEADEELHADPGQPQDSRLTRVGAALGTVGYMAPEQARGAEVDARADVFSLGSILATILTGESPCSAESPVLQLAKAQAGEIDLPQQTRHDLPADLATIAAGALAVVPEQRTQSAEELARQLTAWLEGRPVPGHRYGLRQRASRLFRQSPGLFAGLAASFFVAASAVLAGFELRDRATRAERNAQASTAKAKLEAALPKTAGKRDLAGALVRLAAAEQWHALAPLDPRAANALHEAACALGDRAAAEQQWPLAAQAFAAAERLTVAPAEARAKRLEVEAQATEEPRRRRAEVLGWLDRVEREAPPLEVLQEAIHAIVKHPEPDVVALLTARLDQVSARLQQASRETYLAALEPDDVERVSGEGRLIGLPGAIDAFLETGELTTEQQALLSRASARLEGRSRRAGHAHSSRDEAGRRQLAAVGPGGVAVARVCCDALGWLGEREAAVPSLARFLRVVANPQPAIVAGLSLVRLGGDEALAVVHWSRKAFGVDSFYSRSLERALRGRQEVVPPQADTAPGLVKRAWALMAQQDLHGAREDLLRAVALDPDHAPAWVQLGAVEAKLKATDRALQALLRAVELTPDSRSAWTNLASVRLSLGDYAGCLRDSERSIRLGGNNAEAHYIRAQVHFMEGRTDQGAAELEEALEDNPNLGELWVSRAELRRTRGDMAGAQADVERALRLEPDLAYAWVVAAMLALDAGRYGTALEAAERAVALEPANALAYDKRAQAGLRQGDPERAIADHRKAIELMPDRLFFRLSFARSLMALTHYDEVERVANGALSVDPTDPGAYFFRAWARLRKQRTQEAAADLERAIHLAERNGARAGARLAEMYQERARVRLQLGDREGALLDADRSVELEPHAALVRAERGGVRFRVGDLNGALEDYEAAVRLDPNLGEAWFDMGYALMERGDPGGARGPLERATRLLPQDPNAWALRAQAARLTRNFGEAVQHADQALRFAPTFSDAWLVRGHSLLELRRWSEAQHDLERFLKLDPNHPQADWVREEGLPFLRRRLEDER